MITDLKSYPKYVVVPAAILLPYILITFCFPLWGFANDITNPMVSSFKTILLMKNWQSALIQAAFYGGYFAMAFPAALFIKRFSYKSGILMGLGLYALGGLLFIPSSYMGQFAPFLIAYFILTCGPVQIVSRLSRHPVKQPGGIIVRSDTAINKPESGAWVVRIPLNFFRLIGKRGRRACTHDLP